ncbi:glycosyltransferase [Corticicoccus populi]|uniref:Glycosyltransferase n=1 Tax=Corticicoccus populi TaxID=1812821 RepID=A0ABW5WUC6_9STAP
MNYLYSVLSYTSFKLNMPTFARGFFKKSLSMKTGSKEPGISLYVRGAEHAALFEIIERVNVDNEYKAYLKALVHRHEKNYKRAYELIENDNNPEILGFKVRLLYDLKRMKDIVDVSRQGHDVLKDLTDKQQQTILKYFLTQNMFEEADRILKESQAANENLYNAYEDAKNNIFYKYTWTQYKTRVLELDDFETDNLIHYKTYIDEQSEQMQGLGYVLLINQYFDKSEAEEILNNAFVPYINSNSDLLQYVDPAAVYKLHFNFEDESDEAIQLQNTLNQLYINQPSKQIIDNVTKGLEHTLLNHQHIFTIRRLMIEGKIRLTDKAFKKLFSAERKLEPVFYNAGLFTETVFKSEIDQFVYQSYSGKQQKRVYSMVIKQLHSIDGKQVLPERIMSYLENNAVKMSHTVVLAKQYYITGQTDKVKKLIKYKSKDKQLKIHIQLAKFLFNTKDFQKSLSEIKKAYEIKPKNADVLRGLIRAHHTLGNVTDRFECLELMKKYHPARIFPGEFPMAKQEYDFYKNNWEVNSALEYDSSGTDKKKVLFVLNKALPVVNGYTIRSNEIVKRVKENGYTPVITTRLGWSPVHENYDIPKENINDIQTYYIDKSEKYLTNKTPILEYLDAYAEEIKAILDKEKPGIIHAASNFQNALPALKLGKKFGIKTIYEVRGMWHHTTSSKISGFLDSARFNLQEQQEVHCCNIADQVFCISESLKTYLIGHGVDEDKITVIPNGVDTESISPQELDNELIQSYHLDNHHVLGFIGSITSYEGIDLVIQAMNELNQNPEITKKFKFIIVGDGQHRSQLQNLVDELNMQNDVIFTGRIPHEEVAKYYSVIDIAPFARTNDLVCKLVTPIKTYEAMAMAKKVIVSDVGALKEMVIDRVNGMYFEADNKEELKRAIQNITSQENLGTSARDWVIKERDWKVIIQNVVSEY